MTRLFTLGETLGLLTGPVGVTLPHATGMDLGLGGAESNVAVGVRRLGGAVTWAGRVGTDSLGTLVVRELTAEGIDVVAVRDPAAPTAVMLKERPTGTSATVTYYRAGSAGSRLTPDDVAAAFPADTTVVHLTGITPGLGPTAAAAVDRALDLAETYGAAVSLDVNHRNGVWRARDAAATYRRLAARCSVVFAGEDEARMLTGTGTRAPLALLAELAELLPGDVVLKLGDAGCVAVVDGAVLAQAAVPVAVLDTVGAGDAFVAGYLAELMAEAPAVDRLRTAVACGARACTVHGDWEGAPTRADLQALAGSGADPVAR